MPPTLTPDRIRRFVCLFILLGLLLITSSRPPFSSAAAHEARASAAAEVGDPDHGLDRSLVTNPEDWRAGPTLIVTNTSMDRNGDDWLPERLIADPGPDGISLAEALAAANSSLTPYNQREVITFDPALMGAVITATFQLDVIRDGLIIDGDLNDDGVPDITLDGQGATLHSGLWIQGASDIIVEGMHFRNFGNTSLGGTGIGIGYNIEQDLTEMQDIELRNNWVTNVPESCIEVTIQDRTHAWIRNIEIVGNRLEQCSSGVTVWPGLGLGTADNEISHVKIISNTMTGDDSYTIGITVRGAGMTGNENSHRNLVDDVEIRGNRITGQGNIAVLLDAANRKTCNDNVLRNITIAENVMDGTPMNIEVVATGMSGSQSSGNVITGIHIMDNVLTGGGIQLVGAQAWGASGNSVREVIIERNTISACANAGVLLYPADRDEAGMDNNFVEDVIVRNNLVVGCTGSGLALDCQQNSCADGNWISDVSFLNNTVIDNGFDNGVPSTWAAGIRLDTDNVAGAISGVTISNTILWGNNYDDALVTPYTVTALTVANSVISDTRYTGNNGNFYSDPRFVGAAGGDYRLQSSSPCIDAGDPSGAFVGPLDLDRAERIWDGDGDTGAVVDCGAYEFDAPGIPEIAVFGNGYLISDGDVVPIPWDGTAFGGLRVADETLTHTFTIHNTGVATLTLTGTPRVEITGAHAADFTVVAQPAGYVRAGEASTLSISFDPSAKGLRTASVSIATDDLDENPTTFNIQGVGITPEIRIEGNDLLIPDGDTTPSETDGTDFGTVNTGGYHSGRMYVLLNTGGAPLALTGTPPVTIIGPHAADFSVTAQPSTTVAVDSYPYPAGSWPSFSLSFQPQAVGLRSATVSIASDDLDENPYTFAIQGTGVDKPVVNFQSPSYSVGENIGTAVLTVTLSPTSTESVIVDYHTESTGDASGCTGSGDCDYQPIFFSQATFDPGASVTTLEVDIVDDDLFENPTEDLKVQIHNVTNNAAGAPATATVVIEDNESPPSVSFSTTSYAASEDAGSAPITVTLEGRSALTATVTVSTTGDTASPTADFIPIDRSLTFTPGVTSQVVPITLINDTLVEGNETLALALSQPREAVLGTAHTAALTINDDDGLPVVAFHTSTYTTTENVGTTPVTVTLNKAAQVTATVVISATGGSATEGVDYAAIDRTLVFSPGVTSQVIAVEITADELIEDDETVEVALGEPVGVTIGSQGTALLIIEGSKYDVYLPLTLRQAP